MKIRLFRGDTIIKETGSNYGEAETSMDNTVNTNHINNTSDNEREPQCRYLIPIDNEKNVTVVEGQPDEFLSQIIKKNRLQAGHIELDCSGTGTGKTTRILEDLIPYASEKGLHILYVAPRKMLLNQIIPKIAEKAWYQTKKNSVTEADESCDDKIGIQTFYFSKSPNITVMSAQKLYYVLDKALKNNRRNGHRLEPRYHIVVFDEIHMILDDSSFSIPMNFVLDKIFQYCTSSVSYIFMSATMEGVDRVIYESANKHLGRKINMAVTDDHWVENYSSKLMGGPGFDLYLHYTGERIKYEYLPPFTKYLIPADYSNYVVRYINNEMDDIVSIYKSLPEKRKLLIFVQSISKGKELLRRIPGSVFIFSEKSSNEKLSDAARAEWENIKNKEMFECKCLITTKVLDAGVNLHDDNLCDVVVLCDEKNEFIQCIGRKRNISRSTVTLYIAARNRDYFADKKFNCLKKLKAVSSFKACNNCRKNCCNKCDKENFFKTHMEACINDPKESSKLKGVFSYIDNELTVNPMAKIKLEIQMHDCKKIIARFKTDGEKAFILEQLSWLGLEDTYSEDNWYNQDTKPPCVAELIDLLESNRIIDEKEKILSFRKEIEKILVSLGWYKKRPECLPSIQKINRVLEDNDIHYKIESDTKKSRTIWIINKIQGRDHSE